jgi:hypothetical protein
MTDKMDLVINNNYFEQEIIKQEKKNNNMDLFLDMQEINLNNYICSEESSISQYDLIGLKSVKIQDDFEFVSNANFNIYKDLVTLCSNKKINSETQTDDFYNPEIIGLHAKIELLEREKQILQTQNIKLSNDNTRLINSFNEVSKLLVNFTKININCPEIEDIKTKLTILINRELRMKCPFPFTSILSKLK